TLKKSGPAAPTSTARPSWTPGRRSTRPRWTRTTASPGSVPASIMTRTLAFGTGNGPGRRWAMAKITMKGMDVYLRQLQDLAADTDSMCKMAVYEGTRVVAAAVRDGIKPIPDQNRPAQNDAGYRYQG